MPLTRAKCLLLADALFDDDDELEDNVVALFVVVVICWLPVDWFIWPPLD